MSNNNRQLGHASSGKLNAMGKRNETGTALLAVVLLLVFGGCVTTPRAVMNYGANNSECVVLLHGLNRSWKAMRPMAEALTEAGFTTANIDYPSHAGSVAELVPLSVGHGLQQCRDAGATKIHFVTHSIGGILLRYAHNESPITDIGRVVMLAPPNHGSEVIDKTRNWPGVEIFSGEAGLELGTDGGSIPSQLGPVDFELGVIAGTGTVNAIMSEMLPKPNDGKVSVESTRLMGMTDFLIVDNSHHYITEDEFVIANTMSYLQTGTFSSSPLPADSLQGFLGCVPALATEFVFLGLGFCDGRSSDFIG